LSDRPASIVGRFAPSPTGDLHVGSLIAALASFCDAKQRQGEWRVRIDDIDPPREVPGTADSILRTLQVYGFQWDGEVIYQSQHLDRYRQALLAIDNADLLFACSCSRRDLADSAIYPGTCRSQKSDAKRLIRISSENNQPANQENPDRALRIHLHGSVSFDDRIQGPMHIDLSRSIGDIVLQRRDGLVAYALACAVDDADGITDVVRGTDLLPTTAAQIAVMQALGNSPPVYTHVPIAVNNMAQKLSKQTQATTLNALPPLRTLLQAWQFLGQQALAVDSIPEFWTTAPGQSSRSSS